MYEFFVSTNQDADVKDSFAEEGKTTADLSGKEIFDRGIAGDELCKRTLHFFIKQYGIECGNYALKILPYGGLYLVGGVT